jgi:hypothetical protein
MLALITMSPMNYAPPTTIKGSLEGLIDGLAMMRRLISRSTLRLTVAAPGRRLQAQPGREESLRTELHLVPLLIETAAARPAKEGKGV